MSPNGHDVTHEVMIVGAGPTGLAAAISLARAGIDVVVLERKAEIDPHPRGHVVNARTMEIFRQWGIAETVRRRAVSPRVARRISWATALDEPEIGSMIIPPEPEDASPVHSVSCAQDRLEEILLREALEHGADVRYGVEATGLTQLDGGTVRLRTGDGTTHEARYLIAADGAGSTIRKQLGVDYEGPGYLGSQINIAFEAKLEELLGDRRSLLTWIIHTDHAGVFIDMGENRWVFNLSYDDRKVDRSEFDDRRCTEILRDLVPGIAEPVLRSIHAWRLASQIAQTYRVGNVFLCGDAAHQFPPTGGLGANTGIADAHNLTWKLAQVLRGDLDPSALDTYETERRPIAQVNSGQSLENALAITETGVGPSSNETARILAAGGSEAEQRLARIRAAIPEQLEHFSHIGQDLGYAYAPNQLIADEPDPAPEFEITTYRPRIRAGHRFPHEWVRPDVSTLDLIDGRYVLFTSETGDWPEPVGLVDGVDHAPLAESVAATVGCSGAAAVLVRPDGHIAGRFERPGSDALRTIRRLRTGSPEVSA